MRRLAGAVIAVLVAITTFEVNRALAQSEEPLVTAWFRSRNVEEGPAFLVECRNTTGAPLDSGSMFWALDDDDFKIDGRQREPRGRMGPGLVSEIPPDGTWRGIVEIRQTEPRNFYAVALGANTRAAYVVPLQPGRHTIAVRCGDVWSEDVAFYWER